MKKIFLAILMTIGALGAYAQNTFPSSGNVGIGTTSPVQVLDVIGNGGAFSSTAKAIVSFAQDHTNQRGIYFGYDGAGQIGIIAGNSTGAASNLAFWNHNGSNWFEAMRLTSSGYLGIGTPSPQANLQVNGTFITSGGNANLDPSVPINNLSYLKNTGEMLVGWNRAAGSGETDFIANQGPGAVGGFAFYNHDNNNDEKQLMWIMGNGNVLIGKTGQANLSYMLDVNGNIRANQITVNTTGADFVFEPSYHLTPLSEIKTYLDKNHHLPEIASAKEMQANGLNVGENEVKLLQKVEELTLYLIEQQKTVQILQEQINELNKKLSSKK
jgi:hypothetical protein